MLHFHAAGGGPPLAPPRPAPADLEQLRDVGAEFGNRAVSTNLYFREKNFRIIMMRKFRLAEPVHLMCWVENFSRSQSATGIEGEGAGALMKVHVLPSQSEICGYWSVS